MKKFILIASILLILIFLSITLFLRGDFVSEKVKTYAIAELEHVTQHKVKIEKTVLNLFPTYIELKGTELFDKDGRPIIKIKKARGFIGLGRPLRKELRLRVKVTEPSFIVERYKDGTYNLSPLIIVFKKYLKEEPRIPVKLDFKGLNLEKGTIDFLDKPESFSIHGKGLSLDLSAGQVLRLQKGLKINAKTDELNLKIGSFPDLLIRAEASLKTRENLIRIEKLKITNLDSSIGIEGDLSLSEKPAVDLKTKIILMARSFREFLGVKEKPKGEILISGKIKGDLPRFENGKPQVLPDLDLDVKTELPVYLIKKIVKKENDIEGILSLEGNLRGKYPELISKGTFALLNGEIYGINVKRIESKFDYQSRKLTLSDIKGEVLDGALEGRLSALKTEKPGIEGIDGNGFIRYTKRGDREVKGFTPSIIEKAELTFSSKEGYLNIEKGNISTPYSSGEFQGSLSLKTFEGNLPFRIHSENFSEWVDPYYKGTKGALDIHGVIKGPLDEPTIESNAEISNAEVKGVSIQRAYGGVRYKDREISLSGFLMEQGSGSYIIDGKVRFGEARTFFDAKARLKDIDPVKVTSIFYRELPIETTVSGEMSFRGGGREYEGKAVLTFNKGKAYRLGFDRARVNANLKRTEGSPGEVTFQSVEIEKGNDTLYADGRIGFDESFHVTVLSKRINLKDIDLLSSLFTGNTSLRITGKGTFKKPEIIASLELEKVSYRGGLFGEGNVSISIKDAILYTSARVGGFRIDGEMAFRDDLPWNANILMKDARLEDFLIHGGAIPAPTNSGKVSIITTGSIKAEGKGIDLDRMSLIARLNSILVNIFGHKVENDGEGRIDLKERDLKVHSLRFKGPEGSAIEIGGDLRIKGFYDLYLYGKADIGILKAFIPQIETLNGDGEFMVALSDRWQDPMIQGMINFKGGSLKIKDFPHRIGKLSGTLSFEKDRLVLDSLQGELGGGRFDFSGFASLKKGFSLKNFYLHGNAQGVRYRYFEGFTTIFDGTLSYEGDMKTQSLSGDIIFRKALYSRRIDWKSWLLEVRKIEEKPKAEVSPLLNTNLNIHLSGNIQVDNNIGKGPVGLDLLLKGTPVRPLLFGRIESTEGQIFFRNNSFRVISATADFFDPNRIYPIFNMVADTELKGYRIQLSLSGPIDRFSLSLSSDPPLSETDILALLTVGQPVKGLQGLEAGVGASEAASFLTGKLQDVLEERFRRIAGVDRFQVDPYVTRSSVAGGPRLTVGKSLLDGKLYMTYSANIGTSEEQVLKVEYKLGKNVSLVGVRDEQGQVGGDLKFRLEFR
jgi:translocation and assembly module TamB